MRFAPEANQGCNAGLSAARDKLEEVKKQFPQITYSDLWVSLSFPCSADSRFENRMTNGIDQFGVMGC